MYGRDGECAGGKREIAGGDGITTAKRKKQDEKTTEHRIGVQIRIIFFRFLFHDLVICLKCLSSVMCALKSG
jgi:hypothetical protein